MRPNLSSRSRATAFLWLMWWYLESDFSSEAALDNPFGPGQYGPSDEVAASGMPIKCPAFDFLTAEMEALENLDTVDEKIFGEIKRKERIGTVRLWWTGCMLTVIAILESDMAPVVTGPKRTNKKGELGLVTYLSHDHVFNIAIAFNQNPVFSVLAEDGASTPGRERQSPSHGKPIGQSIFGARMLTMSRLRKRSWKQACKVFD